MEALLGSIIGGLAALGGSIIGHLLTARTERKKRLDERSDEAIRRAREAFIRWQAYLWDMDPLEVNHYLDSIAEEEPRPDSTLEADVIVIADRDVRDELLLVLRIVHFAAKVDPEKVGVDPGRLIFDVVKWAREVADRAVRGEKPGRRPEAVERYVRQHKELAAP